MAATNTKSTSKISERLAGGFGAKAAKQDAESLLRRVVMASLLWEDLAYEDGTTTASQIQELVPLVAPERVAEIAVSARFDQKLRHVPLLICREMARHATHKGLVAETLAKVIHRPDEMTEFLSIYWKDNNKKTLSAQVKKGLAAAAKKFSEYQLAKWNRAKTVALRDVLRLVHPTPRDEEQGKLWKRLLEDKLATPDTWEVGLSAAKTDQEKLDVWSRLIQEKKLGAFAFLKNLRNMQAANVSPDLIREGLGNLKTEMLLPIDFLKAQKYAPRYTPELEKAMLKCAAEFPKLRGRSIFVVDVSGSMQNRLSVKSEFNRMDAATAMAVLAAEMCEDVAIYATAGSDLHRTHSTELIKNIRGFALSDAISDSYSRLGGGGIFTRQCLDWIKSQETETPDRIIIFSDSQDCDYGSSKTPNPFGKRNYIVDVSSHRHGINYAGVWTAEIAGWSESFLKFIAAMEANVVTH